MPRQSQCAHGTPDKPTSPTDPDLRSQPASPTPRSPGQNRRPPSDSLRARLKIRRGPVFEEKAGWRGATREHTRQRSVTEEQRSQPAFSSKTLRATVLLGWACVGSAVTARCGDAPASPPWPSPKSLVAGPLPIFRRALTAHQATNQASTAFCTCSRFSACSKIVSAWASNVASSISLPRYAGRQCITSAPGFATPTSPAFT